MNAADRSSAPEAEYLNSARAQPPRRVASAEPAFRVVPVSGRPYLLPVLADDGPGQRLAAAEEFDLLRTSATVVAEMNLDPDAIECVRTSAPAATEELLVPAALVGAIIGKGGKTKERLERETGASIVVPRGGSGSGEAVRVQLSAPQPAALESAATRLSMLLSDARTRAPPTHFVSLPLRSAATQARVRRFADEALAQHAGGGLTPEMLAPPARLHATLCMLKLLTPQEVARARAALEAARAELTAACAGAPALALRGLELMNDDPSAVDVLYAKAEAGAAGEALQAAWRAVTARLAAAGVLEPDEVRADLAGKLKVHATLLNTRWRRAERGADGARGVDGARVPYDARGLLASHGDFDFGAEALEELHLSRLAAPFEKPSGYYHAEMKLALR